MCVCGGPVPPLVVLLAGYDRPGVVEALRVEPPARNRCQMVRSRDDDVGQGVGDAPLAGVVQRPGGELDPGGGEQQDRLGLGSLCGSARG